MSLRSLLLFAGTFLIFLGCSQIAESGNAGGEELIRGRIIDIYDKPIAGARITIVKSGVEVFTNANGEYTVSRKNAILTQDTALLYIENQLVAKYPVTPYLEAPIITRVTRMLISAEIDTSWATEDFPNIHTYIPTHAHAEVYAVSDSGESLLSKTPFTFPEPNQIAGVVYVADVGLSYQIKVCVYDQDSVLLGDAKSSTFNSGQVKVLSLPVSIVSKFPQYDVAFSKSVNEHDSLAIFKVKDRFASSQIQKVEWDFGNSGDFVEADSLVVPYGALINRNETFFSTVRVSDQYGHVRNTRLIHPKASAVIPGIFLGIDLTTGLNVKGYIQQGVRVYNDSSACDLVCEQAGRFDEIRDTIYSLNGGRFKQLTEAEFKSGFTSLKKMADSSDLEGINWSQNQYFVIKLGNDRGYSTFQVCLDSTDNQNYLSHYTHFL